MRTPWLASHPPARLQPMLRVVTCCRLSQAGHQAPLVAGWRVGTHALDASTGFTARWADNDLLEANPEAVRPQYYRQHAQDEWPECQGWCFFGRCTIFAKQPACCWASPLRAGSTSLRAAEQNSKVDGYASTYDDNDADGAGAGLDASIQHRRHGFHMYPRDEETPHLCWS